MIVFAESNFLLEIALRQPEAEQAQRLLEMAEAKEIRLVLPAYALVEPIHKLVRIASDRKRFSQELDRELKDMARSSNFADVKAQSNAMMVALATKSDMDESEFWKVVDRAVLCSDVIPLTAEIVKASSIRTRVDLEAQDAVMFESVSSYLKESVGVKSIFVTRNAKDFLIETVENDLKKLGCEILVSFGAARGRVEAAMKNEAKAN